MSEMVVFEVGVMNMVMLEAPVSVGAGREKVSRWWSAI